MIVYRVLYIDEDEDDRHHVKFFESKQTATMFQKNVTCCDESIQEVEVKNLKNYVLIWDHCDDLCDDYEKNIPVFDIYDDAYEYFLNDLYEICRSWNDDGLEEIAENTQHILYCADSYRASRSKEDFKKYVMTFDKEDIFKCLDEHECYPHIDEVNVS